MAFLVTAWALAVMPAAALDWPAPDRDLNLALGTRSLDVGDAESAYVYFEKARLADPKNPRVLALLIRTSLELGRLERAEAHLDTLLAESPGDGEALFYRGYIHYLRGRYREALVAFAGARGADRPVEALDFYEGACWFRLGEYERARRLFLKVIQSRPGAHPESRFYLGAIDFEHGRYQPAEEEFEAVVAAEKDSRLGRAAAELLDETRRRMAVEKPYVIEAAVGAAYDSNVVYEPETEIVGDKDGFYGFTEFDGVYYPYRSTAGHMGFGGSYRQTVHTERQDEFIRDFDLLRLAGSVDLDARVPGVKPALFASTRYEYSDVYLGADDYQNTHELLPGLTLVETDRTATMGQAAIQWKNFPEFSGRDSTYWSPSLAQVLTFNDQEGQAGVRLSFEQNESDSDFYDFRGLGVMAAVVCPIVKSWSGEAAVQWRYLDYVFHPDRRIDRRMDFDAAIRYAFNEHFFGRLDFQHARNDSLSTFSWEKNVTGLSMALAY